MRALVLIALVGCGGGGSGKPTTPPTNGSGSGSGSGSAVGPVAAQALPVTPANVCRRMMELKAQSCGDFGGLKFDEKQCLDELAAVSDNPTVKLLSGCVVQPSCEEVKGCLQVAAQQAADNPAETLGECTDQNRGLTPVGLAKADWDKRNGAGAKKYSQVVSTKEKPVEMCGIRQENDWLMSLACDDGTQPLNNPEDARIGSLGAGGRCGSIIDKYQVKCGAKSYDIFIDAYVCPKP